MTWTAQSADDPPARAESNAPAATWSDTERPSEAESGPERLPTPTSVGSRPRRKDASSADGGSTHGDSAPASMSPTSKNSDAPSSGSTRRWRQPRNVREFAAQANAVATLVLNGGIGLEEARLYSSVARTVAQAMSTEVSRSRFVQSEPSLDLPDDVFEDAAALQEQPE